MRVCGIEALFPKAIERLYSQRAGGIRAQVWGVLVCGLLEIRGVASRFGRPLVDRAENFHHAPRVCPDQSLIRM